MSDASRILHIMNECSQRLPDAWEPNFWAGSVASLVELICEAKAVLTVEQQGVLVSIGALMIRQIGKEDEAAYLTSGVLDRVRHGGAL